jgi:hypothetical protein
MGPRRAQYLISNKNGFYRFGEVQLQLHLIRIRRTWNLGSKNRRHRTWNMVSRNMKIGTWNMEHEIKEHGIKEHET